MPHISGLFVYPIKSCAGVRLTEAIVGERGILHDREFMIVEPRQGRMLTQRDYPRMCLIRAMPQEDQMIIQVPKIATEVFSFSGETDQFERQVAVWDDTVPAFDQGKWISEILSAFLETDCRLVRMDPNHFRKSRLGDSGVAFADAYPFLGIGDASLEDLNGRLEEDMPMNRFRPNITFAGTAPFAEDSWRVLKIGDMHLIGETLCARCAVPTTDQATGARGKEPSATLAKFRLPRHIGNGWKTPYKNKVYFGRNFNFQGEGVLEEGMEVEILEQD